MNQTLNSASYSFVQQGSSRVNLTAKPSTATTENRISTSPYRPMPRREPIDNAAGRSPSRRTINFNYTNVSPLKEVQSRPVTRSEAVQVANLVEEKPKTVQSNIVHPQYTQQPAQTQHQHSHQLQVPQQQCTLPVVHHNPAQSTQASQIHSTPQYALQPQNSRIHAEPKPTSKIMASDKKSAIDQIINNCTQLNSRIQDENVRLNEGKQSTIAQKGASSVAVNLANWPTKQQQKPTTIIQPQQQTQQLLCINGDNKKAKYRAQDNPNNVFCSKCSIILVGKGIRIIDIEPQRPVSSAQIQGGPPQLTVPPPTIIVQPPTVTQTRSTEVNREHELKQFVGSVAHLKETLLKNLQGIDKQRQQLVTRSKEQKDMITKTYDELFLALKEYETKDLNRVLYYQEECMRHLQTYQTEFKESVSKLDLIYADITPNINMIKIQIEQLQYRAFLSDYRKQLKQVAQKVQTYNKNISCSAKPQVIRKDITKLSYDIVSLIDYPIGFNKNSLYFSFEAKNSSGSSTSTEKANTILVEDYGGESASLELSQSGTVDDSLPVGSAPFRALFIEDGEEGEGSASPNFKKL